jgi:hypothetical protein
MRIRTLTTAAMTAAAIAAAAEGAAAAAPAQAPMHYTAKLVNGSVVVQLDQGSFSVAKGAVIDPTRKVAEKQTPDKAKPVDVVAVENAKGDAVGALPLTYRYNNVAFPIAQQISQDRKTLTLTPKMDPFSLALVRAAKPAGISQVLPAAQTDPAPKAIPQAQAIASPAENNLAQQNLMNNLDLSSAIGALVGTGLGLIAGVVLGLPTFGLGWIVSVPLGATLGGIIGTLVAGGPTLVASGLDYIQTLQARPHTTHWQVDLDQDAANKPH